MCKRAVDDHDVCITFLNVKSRRGGFDKGPLNYPSWTYQTMQMYGNFEGFPFTIVHCLGW